MTPSSVTTMRSGIDGRRSELVEEVESVLARLSCSFSFRLFAILSSDWNMAAGFSSSISDVYGVIVSEENKIKSETGLVSDVENVSLVEVSC